MPEARGLVQVSFEELGKIDDGRLAVAVEQALRRVTADIEDRPGLKKPRTLNLSLSFIPVFDTNTSTCDGVKMSFKVKESVPVRESKAYDLGVRKGNLLTYQPLSLDNHTQETIFSRDAIENERRTSS